MPLLLISFLVTAKGRRVVEETSNFDELFSEQMFKDNEDSQRYFDQYVVNPVLDFPRPVVS